MSALSDFLENQLTDWLLRGQTFTLPSAFHVALFTVAPTDSTAGTEVSGGGYARVSVTRSLANWSGTQGAGTTVASNGTGGQSSNNNAITFPAPTANWGSIVAVAIMDAASAGNMWAYGSLTQAKTVNNGDAAPSFPAGTLTFTWA